MAGLLDVPAAIMAIGKAISAAAGEAKDSVRELREEIEATRRASSTMTKAPGGGTSGMGSSSNAAPGTAALAAALQMARGRMK